MACVCMLRTQCLHVFVCVYIRLSDFLFLKPALKEVHAQDDPFLAEA